MDNDLNIPKALGKLFPFVREINRFLDREELDGDQVSRILDFMRLTNDVLEVMDFQLARAQCPSGEIDRGTRQGTPREGFSHGRCDPHGIEVAGRPRGGQSHRHALKGAGKEGPPRFSVRRSGTVLELVKK